MIGPFTGDHSFLSNFHPSPIKVDAFTFPTVEHYYQASKAAKYDEFMLVYRCPTPAEAKRAGRKVQMKQSFEQDKKAIMLEGVIRKFQQNPELRHRLIATGDEELVEFNTWGDAYWGCPVNGYGENWLGRVLMITRAVLG